MSNPTVAKVIQEMQLRYTAPKHLAEPEQKKLLLLLATDLEKFDAEVLAKVWDRFPSKYRFQRWPTIADIQKVADEVDFAPAGSRTARKPLKPDEPDERYARAQMGTLEARRAAEEGYAAGFFDWCAKNKTVPTEADHARIKATSLRLRREARRKAEQFPIFKGLLDALEGREATLAAKILEPAETR